MVQTLDFVLRAYYVVTPSVWDSKHHYRLRLEGITFGFLKADISQTTISRNRSIQPTKDASESVRSSLEDYVDLCTVE